MKSTETILLTTWAPHGLWRAQFSSPLEGTFAGGKQ